MDELILLGRGLIKHCPVCGSGHLFKRWTNMVDHCPRCGWNFEHEEGYWVGAMSFNIAITELVFAALLAIVVLSTWPSIPVLELVIIGLVLNGLFPIFYYPFSKTLWTAVDLAFFNRIPRNKIWRAGRPQEASS